MIPRRIGAPLSAALAGLLFGAATVLPALHEWRVGRAEAVFHAAAARSGGPGLQPPAAGHQHHGPDSCCLCPLFFGSRQTAPRGVCAAGAPDPVSSLQGVASGPCTREDEFGVAPRGPPAASA